jgi:hypothetical protein
VVWECRFCPGFEVRSRDAGLVWLRFWRQRPGIVQLDSQYCRRLRSSSLALNVAGSEKSGSSSNGSNCGSSLIAQHTRYINNPIRFVYSFIPNTTPRCIVPKPQACHLVAQVGVRLFLGGFGLLCFGFEGRGLATSTGEGLQQWRDGRLRMTVGGWRGAGVADVPASCFARMMAAASSFAFASSDPDFCPTTLVPLPVIHCMSSIHIHRCPISVHPLVPLRTWKWGVLQPT